MSDKPFAQYLFPGTDWQFVKTAHYQPLRRVENRQLTRELRILRIQIRRRFHRFRNRVRDQVRDTVFETLPQLELHRVVPCMAQALIVQPEHGLVWYWCNMIS